MAVPLGLVGDVVLLLGHNATVTTALPATAHCLGVALPDLIGRWYLDLLHEPQVEEVMAALNEAQSKIVHFDCRFKVALKGDSSPYLKSGQDTKPEMGHQWYKATAKPVSMGGVHTVLVSARQWQDVEFGGVSRFLNLTEPGHRHYKLTRMDGSIAALLSAPTGRLFTHRSNIFDVQNPIHYVRPIDLPVIAKIYREGLLHKKPTAAVIWFQDAVGGWNCYYGGLIPCVNKQTGGVEFMYGWGKHVDYCGWEPTEPVPEIEFPNDYSSANMGQVIEFDGYDDLVSRCSKMCIRQEEHAIEEDEWRDAFEAEKTLSELDSYKAKFGPRQQMTGSGQQEKRQRTLDHIPESIIQAAVKQSVTSRAVSTNSENATPLAPATKQVAPGSDNGSRGQIDSSDSEDAIDRPVRKDSSGRPMIIDTRTAKKLDNRFVNEIPGGSQLNPIRSAGLSRSPHPDDWWDPDETPIHADFSGINTGTEIPEIGPPEFGRFANIANEGWNLGLGVVPPPLWFPGANMFSLSNQATPLASATRVGFLDLVPLSLDMETEEWLTNHTPLSTESTQSESSTLPSSSPLSALSPQEFPSSPAKTTNDVIGYCTRLEITT